MPAFYATTVAESLSGFTLRSQIIWAKVRLVLSRGLHWQHEPYWYAVRDGGQGIGRGTGRTRPSGPLVSRDEDQDTSHSTQNRSRCMLAVPQQQQVERKGL
jgi:hypothetical protein